MRITITLGRKHLAVLVLLLILGSANALVQFNDTQPIQFLNDLDLNGNDITDVGNLRDAKLVNVDLRKVKIRDGDLENVNLTKVNITEVDLKNADLKNVNLTEVNLNDVDLKQTNVTEVTLKQVDLKSVNTTRKVTNLNADLLDGKNSSYYENTDAETKCSSGEYLTGDGTCKNTSTLGDNHIGKIGDTLIFRSCTNSESKCISGYNAECSVSCPSGYQVMGRSKSQRDGGYSCSVPAGATLEPKRTGWNNKQTFKANKASYCSSSVCGLIICVKE